MFKTIVASVILFLFVLQVNNSLFAFENEEAKAKAEVSSAIAEVSATIEEASAEESTTAVAETVESTEAVVVEEAVTTAFPTSVNDQITDSVTQSATVVLEEVVTEAKSITEESAEEVVEEVASGISTEAVVEKAAEAVVEEETVTAAESITEVSSEEVVDKVISEVSTLEVVEKVVTSTENAVAVVEKESDVIATVNGEKILRLSFDKRLNVFRRMNQEVTDAVKMQVINQLTKKILLKQFVEKQEVSASAEDIKAEIEKIKFFLQNNPANKDKPLDEILDTQGSSVTELEEEVSRALSLSKYLESTVTDADKKSYFDANMDAFNGARVKASHVLIDTRNLKTDAELKEAKDKIDIVKVQIDKGADFAEMAKKYSNCPSAEKGGDIGFFQRKGSIVEEFAQVAFAMKVGEISEPIKTQFGYHIIMVTEKEDGKEVNYADVSDMVDFVFMQIKTE
ncbi:MAG: hypothetical protein GY775_02350, partial [Candidatus Scalindua sp.]|nr:hypothetical protein [Candidatus Scalindua sp.]